MNKIISLHSPAYFEGWDAAQMGEAINPYRRAMREAQFTGESIDQHLANAEAKARAWDDGFAAAMFGG
jgi:hypothetical protein